MDRIKVAHVITMLELGGAQGNTLFTAEHLDRKRYDVILISGMGGVQDEAAGSIPALKVIFLKHLVRQVRPWRDLLALIGLVRVLNAEKPDVVHTHSSKAGILGRVAAALAGVPVVIHSIHGFGFNPCQKPPVRALFILLERWMARLTDCLIAVSRRNIEQGLALGIGEPGLYELIRSGVDISSIRERAARADRAAVKRSMDLPESARLVTSIGPFKVQKDPVSFMEAAARIARECPDARFLFVGDGELRPRVEEAVRRLGLAALVRLPGWRKDIPEILAASDVFVLTSLWEGLPRAAVEALIAGRPVVAFAVDGIPEIVRDGENGFVLPPGSLDELAGKVARILKDDSLSRRLSGNAERTIDASFDISGMVRDQEKLYERLFLINKRG
ncbi:MAG: hypothetical protein A2902_04285 [Elusimicrobia bacterium RIFCSPLOWO2_01_FULL_64_13]|nr:MAG: hypothetical protein A2902_04285 [Elusimicrobia bacterium RIFCSPLOWO2_01_FULL_64_13]